MIGGALTMALTKWERYAEKSRGHTLRRMEGGGGTERVQSTPFRGAPRGGDDDMRQATRVVPIPADGNCLYRALAHPSQNFDGVRRYVAEHIHSNWEDYKHFVPEEDRSAYYRGLPLSGVWGDELTLQSFAELGNVPVFVYDKHTMQRLARYGPDKVDHSNSLLPRYVVYDGSHYEALEFT